MKKPRRQKSAAFKGYESPFFPEELAELNKIVAETVIIDDCLPKDLIVCYGYHNPATTSDRYKWPFGIKGTAGSGEFVILFPFIKKRRGTGQRYLPRSIAIYKKGNVEDSIIRETIKELTSRITKKFRTSIAEDMLLNGRRKEFKKKEKLPICLFCQTKTEERVFLLTLTLSVHESCNLEASSHDNDPYQRKPDGKVHTIGVPLLALA